MKKLFLLLFLFAPVFSFYFDPSVFCSPSYDNLIRFSAQHMTDDSTRFPVAASVFPSTLSSKGSFFGNNNQPLTINLVLGGFSAFSNPRVVYKNNGKWYYSLRFRAETNDGVVTVRENDFSSNVYEYGQFGLYFDKFSYESQQPVSSTIVPFNSKKIVYLMLNDAYDFTFDSLMKNLQARLISSNGKYDFAFGFTLLPQDEANMVSSDSIRLKNLICNDAPFKQALQKGSLVSTNVLRREILQFFPYLGVEKVSKQNALIASASSSTYVPMSASISDRSVSVSNGPSFVQTPLTYAVLTDRILKANADQQSITVPSLSSKEILKRYYAKIDIKDKLSIENNNEKRTYRLTFFDGIPGNRLLDSVTVNMFMQPRYYTSTTDSSYYASYSRTDISFPIGAFRIQPQNLGEYVTSKADLQNRLNEVNDELTRLSVLSEKDSTRIEFFKSQKLMLQNQLNVLNLIQSNSVQAFVVTANGFYDVLSASRLGYGFVLHYIRNHDLGDLSDSSLVKRSSYEIFGGIYALNTGVYGDSQSSALSLGVKYRLDDGFSLNFDTIYPSKVSRSSERRTFDINFDYSAGKIIDRVDLDVFGDYSKLNTKGESNANDIGIFGRGEVGARLTFSNPNNQIQLSLSGINQNAPGYSSQQGINLGLNGILLGVLGPKLKAGVDLSYIFRSGPVIGFNANFFPSEFLVSKKEESDNLQVTNSLQYSYELNKKSSARVRAFLIGSKNKIAINSVSDLVKNNFEELNGLPYTYYFFNSKDDEFEEQPYISGSAKTPDYTPLQGSIGSLIAADVSYNGVTYFAYPLPDEVGKGELPGVIHDDVTKNTFVAKIPKEQCSIPVQLTYKTSLTKDDLSGKTTVYLIFDKTKSINDNGIISSAVDSLTKLITSTDLYSKFKFKVLFIEEPGSNTIKSHGYTPINKLTLEYYDESTGQLKYQDSGYSYSENGLLSLPEDYFSALQLAVEDSAKSHDKLSRILIFGDALPRGGAGNVPLVVPAGSGSKLSGYSKDTDMGFQLTSGLDYIDPLDVNQVLVNLGLSKTRVDFINFPHSGSFESQVKEFWTYFTEHTVDLVSNKGQYYNGLTLIDFNELQLNAPETTTRYLTPELTLSSDQSLEVQEPLVENNKLIQAHAVIDSLTVNPRKVFEPNQVLGTINFNVLFPKNTNSITTNLITSVDGNQVGDPVALTLTPDDCYSNKPLIRVVTVPKQFLVKD